MATASTSSVDSTKPETSTAANVDDSLLDLVFAIDCTGSMGSYIKEAQTNIRTIVEEIFSKETKDVRLALVQYRDHPPEDNTFVTLVNDFTPSVKKMKSWLEGCSASGGGDTPEAVADALHQVLKLSWRPEATKLCVFIADAPPHGINCSNDHFPNGCPDDLDPMVITQQLAELGVCLYTVGCEPSINEYKPFFKALSHMTGGQYVPLKKANLLPAVIIGGAMEEISLDRWQADADDEIEAAMRARDADDVDETALAEQVYARLRGKGAKAMQLQQRSKALPSAGDRAKTLAGLTTLKDVRIEMTKHDHTQKRRKRGRRSRSRDRDRRSRSRSPDVLLLCDRRRSRSRSRDRDRRSRSRSGDRDRRRSRSRSRDRDRRLRSRSRSRSRDDSDESDDDEEAAYGVVEHDLDMAQARRMVGKYLKKKKY